MRYEQDREGNFSEARHAGHKPSNIEAKLFGSQAEAGHAAQYNLTLSSFSLSSAGLS